MMIVFLPPDPVWRKFVQSLAQGARVFPPFVTSFIPSQSQREFYTRWLLLTCDDPEFKGRGEGVGVYGYGISLQEPLMRVKSKQIYLQQQHVFWQLLLYLPAHFCRRTQIFFFVDFLPQQLCRNCFRTLLNLHKAMWKHLFWRAPSPFHGPPITKNPYTSIVIGQQ